MCFNCLESRTPGVCLNCPWCAWAAGGAPGSSRLRMDRPGCISIVQEHWLNTRYFIQHRTLPHPNPPPYIADSSTPTLQVLGAFPEDVTHWEALPEYSDSRLWTRFEQTAPYLVFNQQTVLFDRDSNPGYYDHLHLFLGQLHTVNQVHQCLIEYEVLPQQYYDFSRFLFGKYPTEHDHRASYFQVREWRRERVLQLATHVNQFNYNTFAPYQSGDPRDIDSVFPDQPDSTTPWPVFYIFIRLIATYGDIGALSQPYGFTDDSNSDGTGHLTENWLYVPEERPHVIQEFVPGNVTYDSDFADAEDNISTHSSDQELELINEFAIWFNRQTVQRQNEPAFAEVLAEIRSHRIITPPPDLDLELDESGNLNDGYAPDWNGKY
ncbi:hypothetical protein BV22DRAFT_1051854 [Leucogyrophana mollusca]|uniref:Uncharacterized protein n=1 Tax=Leucogyrophana mollusca TaxID=85980 RepID=A0ACB8AZ53_9AGAM|nr:hypothetical protein BV22DRAFT_1051854 [Leucogyrophana mollusca]